jgi:hypothetical protein
MAERLSRSLSDALEFITPGSRQLAAGSTLESGKTDVLG